MSVVTPVFMFGRRHDIEIETGLGLAGNLVVDLPKNKKPKRRQKQMITEIIQGLTTEARAGRMPKDAVVFGWPGGRRPPNADDFVNSDEAQMNWAMTRLIIAIRVDSRGDDTVRIDSDIARQIGLIKEH